jgi:hypothetical protein
MMNHNKIKECAEQAGFTYEDHAYNINKLVGIIVQECINSCNIVEEQVGLVEPNSELTDKNCAVAEACAVLIQSKFF